MMEVALCYGQLDNTTDQTKHILDLTDKVRTLWQKSEKEIPANFVALPILPKNWMIFI